jgi:hypothetical protein
MRAIVVTLALLATLKIWVQDSLYRSATEEALVSAYRTRAADACTRISAAGRASPDGVDWTKEGQPRVTVGNPAIAVHIWQFDHELWNARYRQPYLVLSRSGSSASCRYDILADRAEISRS